MIIATGTLVVLALAMAVYAWQRHDGSLRRGIDSGWLTLKGNLALISVAFELPFMGWRFTVVSWGLGLGFPILVGAAVRVLFG